MIAVVVGAATAAAVWFLLGCGFHAWMVWYSNRQQRKADRERESAEAYARILTALRVYWATGEEVFVLRDPLTLRPKSTVDAIPYRSAIEEAWKN